MSDEIGQLACTTEWLAPTSTNVNFGPKGIDVMTSESLRFKVPTQSRSRTVFLYRQTEQLAAFKRAYDFSLQTRRGSLLLLCWIASQGKLSNT